MIDIFQHTNYRIYLKACYEFHKEHSRAFSYRYFSKKCGYKSPNFLKLVIDGKRNLSVESVEKFSHFLKLKKNEAEYFSLLVSFNQAKTTESRANFAREIMKTSTFQRLFPLGRDHFEYYAKWYYVAVREILATKHMKLDAQAISELLVPKVSTVEVQVALDTLMRLGLIKRRDNRYVQTERLVSTGDEVSDSGVAQYHKSMLELAGDSIDTIQRELRDISSVTVGLSFENITELKVLIQRFRKNVLELSDQDQQKMNVYQVGIQMFPLTDIKEET